MYIDLVILIILMIIVIMFFRNFSSFVYFMAIVDILLRILTFIKNNIGLPDVAALIGKYVPESVIAIIDSYTAGIPILNLILRWAFVIIMMIFLGYVFRIFIHKKKI